MDMNAFSLQNKIAWVTGGSYGIGFAIAEAFAAAGATIVFNDISQELVDKGLAAYAQKGVKAHGYVCDVTDESAVQALVAKVRMEVGVIDILVNNAGIIKRIPMTEMSAADFRKVIDVDLNAPFICAKAVIPAMIEKGHGKIINICSMMSELGRETVSAYAAAKGGLKMLTRNICSEYGACNIQCNGIGPGYIETPQTAPCASASQTAAAIPSISSSFPKPQPPAGARPMTCRAPPCSSPPTLPTSSTATCSTWTAASWLTSASSPDSFPKSRPYSRFRQPVLALCLRAFL